MTNYKITMIVVAILIPLLCSTFIFGYTVGSSEVYREAYENGHMSIQRLPDGKRSYRWIETHKLGYDYDE